MTDDVEIDLGPLFESYGSKYSRMREVINARQRQRCQVSKINAIVGRGKTLSASSGRIVTRIHPNIVVKIGQGLDLNEMVIIEHIHWFSESFPSPQPLGSVAYDGTTYHFMTFIEGRSLQDLWPSLSTHLKSDVRDQLSSILLDLRALTLPTEQFGTGIPPRCKDVRRWVRCSVGPIHNEDDFNDFLLSTIKPRIAQTYKDFMRRKIDLHPRNVVAEFHDGHIMVKEYWEYVKSLNTVSSVDEDDWRHYLPVKGMGEYCILYNFKCL
ncbi:hypothetical protein BDU57DRAFT_553137 [Ampelomyces quisqualis]|uniref:Aminoglycoside phosphotransferase domain-containing protein n=1 Tax=Ampelomyces quisqualis TaxID=50730 RepID=A0A6A5QZL9_AMPQU|nr:hypothetical protein BDU57DRAFT_553137 [Ampelomyces quisqualis]